MSIFELKRDESELSSANQGASRMAYDQHAPTRDVTGVNFPNGAIHIRWQVSGSRWWIPARSYLRFRCSLAKTLAAPGGAPNVALVDADDVAPTMGFIANLFQSAEFRINDKTVSRCADFMPQINALETRLSKSKAWLDGIGSSQEFWSPDVDYNRAQVSSDGIVPTSSPIRSGKVALGFGGAVTAAYDFGSGVVTFSAASAKGVVFKVGDTLTVGYVSIVNAAPGPGVVSGPISGVISAVAANGLTVTIPAALTTANVAAADVDFFRTAANKPSRRAAQYEVTWQPPLSIFKTCHALPTGRYELILNPHVSSIYRLLVSESLTAARVPGVDYDFAVNSMYAYVATIEGARVDDTTFMIDLEETRLQVDTVNNWTSLSQKNFDVSPSTFALTLAFQDDRANSTSLVSASKFKVARDADAIRDNSELALTRMFIQYAGQSKPSPDADPEFKAGVDLSYQRYVDSVLGSGSYFDSGSPESIEDFHDRGAYYYFPWARDGSDRSTRVQVNAQFTGANNTHGRVLLFDHSRAVAKIKVEGGAVTDVQVEQR